MFTLSILKKYNDLLYPLSIISIKNSPIHSYLHKKGMKLFLLIASFLSTNRDKITHLRDYTFYNVHLVNVTSPVPINSDV